MPVSLTPPTAPDYAGIWPPGDLLDQDLVATLGDVVLGVTDDRGVRVFLSGVKGWWTTPGSTGEVAQRAGDDGGWSTVAFRTPRHIELEVTLEGDSFDHLTPTLTSILGAVPLRSGVLAVSKNVDATQAVVQQDGDVLVDRANRTAILTIPLVALDPRRYSLDEVTATTGLPVTTGGLSLPLTLPLTIGATVTSGTLTVTNAGNEATRPRFLVSGPCPPFQITQPSTGKRLLSPEAVPAGRSLLIDGPTRTALLDGTAPRALSGSWFDLPPGDSQIAFTADTYDAAARLSVSYRSAWR